MKLHWPSSKINKHLKVNTAIRKKSCKLRTEAANTCGIRISEEMSGGAAVWVQGGARPALYSGTNESASAAPAQRRAQELRSELPQRDWASRENSASQGVS